MLIVDDDQATRQLIADLLGAEGYEVLAAPDGVAALGFVQQTEQEGPPLGLILLDIRMPVMDGWTFLHAYRQGHSRRIPVIACTVSRNAAADALRNGLDAALVKPFDVEELLAVVARCFNR